MVGFMQSHTQDTKVVPTTPLVNPDAIKHFAKAVKLEKLQLNMATENLRRFFGYTESNSEVIKEAQREMKKQLDLYKSAQRTHQMLLEEVDENKLSILRKIKQLCLDANVDAEITIVEKGVKDSIVEKEQRPTE